MKHEPSEKKERVEGRETERDETVQELTEREAEQVKGGVSSYDLKKNVKLS